MQYAGEFAGDIAAADNQNPPWNFLQAKNIIRNNGVFATFDVRKHGPRACRHKYMAGSHALTGRKLDRMRVGKPGAGIVGG